MTPQEDVLEQVYSILDDWKAQRFGGEPIVEALNNLTAMAGTATRQELERIADALQSLAEAVAAQERAAIDTAELAAVLAAMTAKDAPVDEFQQARQQIQDNVAALSERMGPRLDTGDVPQQIDARVTVTPSLSTSNPILPARVFPQGDASIYGAGLDAVSEILVDGNPATIRGVLPSEVRFTVPAGIGPGEVEVAVLCADGTAFAFPVDVGGAQQRAQQSKKGVKS